MRITSAMLRQKGACSKKVTLFEEHWPKGAETTLANCKKAVSLGLDLDWAANHFLPVSARQTYKAGIGESWATYQAALWEAWATYETSNKKEAWATYEAARAEAYASYLAATVRGFYRASLGSAKKKEA